MDLILNFNSNISFSNMDIESTHIKGTKNNDSTHIKHKIKDGLNFPYLSNSMS